MAQRPPQVTRAEAARLWEPAGPLRPGRLPPQGQPRLRRHRRGTLRRRGRRPRPLALRLRRRRAWLSTTARARSGRRSSMTRAIITRSTQTRRVGSALPSLPVFAAALSAASRSGSAILTLPQSLLLPSSLDPLPLPFFSLLSPHSSLPSFSGSRPKSATSSAGRSARRRRRRRSGSGGCTSRWTWLGGRRGGGRATQRRTDPRLVLPQHQRPWVCFQSKTRASALRGSVPRQVLSADPGPLSRLPPRLGQEVRSG